MMISKNVRNEKCAPKLVFFNDKMKKKKSFDFQPRKLTSIVKFWHFLTPAHYTNSQNSIISFGCINSLTKIFLILYPNSKT